MISIDPARARDDPVIVKNVPYYKAKKALETEVMKIDPPPRPPNWGVRIHYLHVMLASYSFLVIMIVQICLCLNNVHNFLSIYNVLLMIALAEFFLFHWLLWPYIISCMDLIGMVGITEKTTNLFMAFAVNGSNVGDEPGIV